MELDKIKVLFFIGSLRSGGKERRLIELLTYLKKNLLHDVRVVLTKDQIDYPDFLELDVPYYIIKKKAKGNYLNVFSKFYKISNEFNPDIIHTWGRIQTFYSLPIVIMQRRFLINSQITAAPPKIERWSKNYFIDRLNFYFSDAILANSYAGIKTYKPPAIKSSVIYNGINLSRFHQLPDIEVVKKKYNIHTPFTVIKIASFTPNKNYRLFLEVAEKVTKGRDDITFIGVGGFDGDNTEYQEILRMNKNPRQIIFPGKISDVEALINACDVGILFTKKEVHGEGISNAVLEYMALGKPVVANDAGGTGEVVADKQNGYLLANHSAGEIAELIIDLVDDKEKRKAFGNAGRRLIEDSFSLDRMGECFTEIYRQLIRRKITPGKVSQDPASVVAAANVKQRFETG